MVRWCPRWDWALGFHISPVADLGWEGSSSKLSAMFPWCLGGLTPDPSQGCNPSSSLVLLAGSLRGYSLVTPSLAAPSLTPPQLAPANLQQFFPQATRQSLLGPPPVGVPMNPSQLSLSGRTPQKQARTSSGTPNRKVSGGRGGAGGDGCGRGLTWGSARLPAVAHRGLWASVSSSVK